MLKEEGMGTMVGDLLYCSYMHASDGGVNWEGLMLVWPSHVAVSVTITCNRLDGMIDERSRGLAL